MHYTQILYTRMYIVKGTNLHCICTVGANINLTLCSNSVIHVGLSLQYNQLCKVLVSVYLFGMPHAEKLSFLEVAASRQMPIQHCPFVPWHSRGMFAKSSLNDYYLSALSYDYNIQE